ncbi:hypothetical protein EDB83DRAFT_2393226 [Lactarius deliciosus]|nr:hypothetical protein EDB83DRAFT_2393226 [Lactarius deliciosus]
MHVKYVWTAVPVNWECLGDPSAGITIDLRIALRSHPSNTRHARYGAHLSKERVAELRVVAPSLDMLELVNSWLRMTILHTVR